MDHKKSINNIKNIIAGKHEEFTEDTLCQIHDILMSEYGWIPLKEFQELPIPTLWSLLDCIVKRYEKQNKNMKKKK